MIVRTISRFTAAALLSLTSGIAIGAQGPIYRCAQADGTLLFSAFDLSGNPMTKCGSYGGGPATFVVTPQ